MNRIPRKVKVLFALGSVVAVLAIVLHVLGHRTLVGWALVTSIILFTAVFVFTWEELNKEDQRRLERRPGCGRNS